MTEITSDAYFEDGKGKELAVAFDYIKAHDFRVVWSDGVIGGITPQNKIHCVFYAERPSIPQRQVFNVSTTEGSAVELGDEKFDARVSRNSIVREMACDVFMTANSARNLATWLLETADELDRSQNAS